MDDIINILRSLPNFVHMTGATESDISSAETALGLTFADDYRKYVFAFGAAAVNGHELTGVCSSKRLNVVDVTIEERNNNEDIPANWYVLEQANIDGIVIWQAPSGEIYQTAPHRLHCRIGASMIDFLRGSAK